MAGKIFVNYRRDDSRADAARLRDRLAQGFGAENVFMDVDNLLVGQRFDKELEKALDQCDVFLAVMGPRWMEQLNTRHQTGERDYVREEIAAALKRGTLVIPVLIERTALPRADQLPPEIAALVMHQKHDVVHESFGRDVAALIDGIKAARKASRQGASGGLAGVSAGRALGLTAAVALMATAFAMYAGWIPMLGLMGSDTAGLAPRLEPETRPASSEPGAIGEGNLREARRLPSMDDNGAGAPPNAAITNGAPSNGKPAAEPEAETLNAGSDPVAAEAKRKAAEAAAAAEAYRERIAMLEKSGVASQAEVDQSKAAAPRPGETFRDCADVCPEMVVVPAGEFTMGSPESEEERSADEGPQRKVTIAKAFAVGKFELTFAEWDACVAAGGCKTKADDNGWGRAKRPITVSWDDAKQYVAWLSKKTGKPFRLLTEAEWEYAARAGTTTPFSTGKAITPDQANFNGNYTYGGSAKGQYREKTIDVGSFKPNAFGLNDMHGNVLEWVEDCYQDSYKGAPTDGTAAKKTSGCRRVLRGGSWRNNPWNLRAAKRDMFGPGDRYFDGNHGFRLARTLTP